MKKLYKLLYIFIITSICGYFVELVWSLVTKGIFINHSAVVIGPFNFAYGICGVALTLLLYKFKDESYLKIFWLSFIGGSILEYIMSWGMELVLGFTAWDYSNNFLNINGRICLLFSIFWGILGILWIKILYPQIFSVYYIFKGIGRSVININNENREAIENMLKKSEYYNQNYNINNLKKIQFFMDFNNYQFILYYENNEKIELYDDDMNELKDYIEGKGYSKAGFYIFIDTVIIILCVCINGMKKKISNEIDYLDKI